MNKMGKIIIFCFFILFIFISACDKESCESGLYADGKCCTYVCDVECSAGYEEGTCNCECKEDTVIDDSTDTNIEDIFDDSQDIEPPVLPSP